MIAVIFLLVVIGLLIDYYKRNFKYDYWEKRNVNYVKPLPFFGNYLPAFLMRMSSGRLIEKIHREYENEPYTGFYVFNKPALLIRDPNIIKMILVKDFSIFNNRATSSVNEKDIIGTYGLFTIKDSHWKTLRNRILPFFSTRQSKLMFDYMVEVGQNFNKEISEIVEKQSNILEMKNTAVKFTTDIIASCVYGVSGPTKFVQITRKIFSISYARCFELNSFFFVPFLAGLFRMSFLGHEGTTYLRTFFWKCVKLREQNSVLRNDFMNLLMELRKNQEANTEESSIFEDDKLVAQAVIFFTAGVEGASTSISHGLYHLALNPDIQRKLRAEIKQVLADNDNHLTFENLNEMAYLDLCVKETFRMAIALPFLDRTAREDYKVPGTDLVIEKGMGVFISLFGMHFDPKNFPNPYQFDPERFRAINKSKIDPYAYLPFGIGPHNCIGYRFAVMQVKIGLIYILKDFEVQVAKKFDEPFKPHPRGFFWTLENGCHLRLIKDT